MTVEKNSIHESALDLPTDFPRSPQFAYRGIHLEGALDPSIREGLERFRETESSALEATLLAAYVALLSRYCGQKEISVGCVRDSSDDSESSGEDVLGLTIQRILSPPVESIGFRDLVKILAERLETTDAIEVAGRVEAGLKPGPTPEAPLCPVAFSCPNDFTRIEKGEDREDLLKADLNLSVAPNEGRFEYRLSGNGCLFARDSLESKMGQFQTLLLAALQEPDLSLERLPLLSDFERKRILVEWNDNALVLPAETCIHHLFQNRAQHSPDAPAVWFRGETLTYEELDRRSNRLANHLIRLGVGPENFVGVFMERSFDLIVALMGVLKSGAAYVPLDPSYPKDRVAFMLEDSKAKAILSQDRLIGELPPHQAQVVRMDSDWPTIELNPDTAPSTQVKPTNLAFTIYTSGSTGKPKGVAIEHASAVALSVWEGKVYTPEELSGVLGSTSICFDLSVFEIFGTLANGGRIVLVENAMELLKTPEDCAITLINTVPSALRELLALGSVPQSVRTVNLAGEPLTAELANSIYATGHVEKVYDLYGPSEDTTYSTYALRAPDGPAIIGKPIDNTQVYLLDRNGQPVPIGVPGEIHLAGMGLARGYLDRPELTAEKFIPDPFSRVADSRMYKTGDLARYLPDGNLELLGRIDHQVKVRGFRIELGEIESVLDSHPSIEKAIVGAREDLPGEKRLVAYVTSSGQEIPNESVMRRFLGEKIPDYMIPSAFVVLEEFPLTPNGKVDRKALPAPQQKRPNLDQAYRAPRNDLEKRLCDLWASNLTIDKVGIDDRFFDLGGNSLQAARFINALQVELGETIYVVSLFEAPTVSEYAAFLDKNYPAAIATKYPGRGSSGSSDGQGARRIESRDLAEIRKYIPALPPGREPVDDAEPKTPGAIFILAPPRSGTTLLRVMLAGHPNLFCPAELQLLGFNTLAERKEAFTGKFSLWAEGTIRALMDLANCDAAEAKAIMAEHENQGLTTKQFYKVLQDKAEGRVLVDKSPSYASDLATLQKAELDFENARYIHLTRHPYSMVRSFEKYRMNQVLFIREHPYSARQLGELLWTVSHQNILAFLEDVPSDRQVRMRYEDLVQQPEREIREMCDGLDLGFHPNLLNPYEETDKKMTDGIYAESTPMGDKKFLQYNKIDPKVAESWKKVVEDNFLGENTWEIAENLGYLKPEAVPIHSYPPAEAGLRDARAERRGGHRDRRSRRLRRGKN